LRESATHSLWVESVWDGERVAEVLSEHNAEVRTAMVGSPQRGERPAVDTVFVLESGAEEDFRRGGAGVGR
jgi:hypothetical protein